MRKNIKKELSFVSIECAACGTPFAVTRQFFDQRQEDHKSFKCPLGHINFYPHETELDTLKKKLAASEKSRLAWADVVTAKGQELGDLMRSNRTLRGHLTRCQNRLLKIVKLLADGEITNIDEVNRLARGKRK